MPTLGATRRAKVKRRKKSAALVAARPIRPGATPAAGIFVLPFTRRGMSWIATGGRQMKKVTLYSRSVRAREPSAPRPRAGLPRVRGGGSAAATSSGASPPLALPHGDRALRTCAARRGRRPVRAGAGLGPCGQFAGAGAAHAEGDRRRRAVHAGERPDAVARGQVVRGRAALGRAGARPDERPARGRLPDRRRRQRRRHRRHGHHSDEPARRQRRGLGDRRVLRRPRIGSLGHRRAAGARSRRAAGEEAARRPAGRHAALDQRPRPPATR